MRVLAIAALTIALATLMVPMAPAAPPSLSVIQPGGPLSELFFPGGLVLPGCTLGFILRDGPGTWYALTAAHCVTLGGQPYLTPAGGHYGVVVADDDLPELGGPADGIDVALIRIFNSKVGLVSPAVRGYGGPTGIATPATAASGHPILTTGYLNGVGVGYPLNVNQIQHAQHGGGILSYFDGPNYRSIQSSIDGCSGGPVIMGDDGQALGLVSAQQATVSGDLPSIDVGPLLSASIARLGSVYGYPGLVLQTAPFSGVPPI